MKYIKNILRRWDWLVRDLSICLVRKAVPGLLSRVETRVGSAYSFALLPIETHRVPEGAIRDYFLRTISYYQHIRSINSRN